MAGSRAGDLRSRPSRARPAAPEDDSRDELIEPRVYPKSLTRREKLGGPGWRQRRAFGCTTLVSMIVVRCHRCTPVSIAHAANVWRQSHAGAVGSSDAPQMKPGA